MKSRAPTLIEILVGASIIGIICTLLAPVIARRNQALLKQHVIDNLRRMSISFQMYSEDFDRTLPRMDGCEKFSSLNPKLRAPEFNDGVEEGCNGRFYNRLNHFSWQKWTRKYIGSEEFFFNPSREKIVRPWNDHGQLVNQFVLNLGFTGAMDTYSRDTDYPRQYRDSWIMGKIDAIPSPSQAALIFELTTELPFVPIATVDETLTANRITGYPLAYREYYRYKLYEATQADCMFRREVHQVDERKASFGGVSIASAEGGAYWLSAEEFLSRTPSKAELGIKGMSIQSGYTFGNDCHGMAADPPGALGIQKINTKVDYPMWGFSR